MTHTTDHAHVAQQWDDLCGTCGEQAPRETDRFDTTAAQAEQASRTTSLTVTVPKGLAGELVFFEVDTLDAGSPLGKAEFVEAFSGAGRLRLTGEALAYAGQANGAFDNAASMVDSGDQFAPGARRAIVKAALRLRDECQQALADSVTPVNGFSVEPAGDYGFMVLSAQHGGDVVVDRLYTIAQACESLTRLAAEYPLTEETTVTLPSTPITAAEARVLAPLWAEGALPSGLVVMEADGTGTDDGWDGVQHASEVSEEWDHILMAESDPGPDPVAVVEALRQNDGVERLACPDTDSGIHTQVSDEQGDDLGAPESNLCAGCLQYDLVVEHPEHLVGAHDEEASTECPDCLLVVSGESIGTPEPSADPDWPAAYAERGIQRDTLACTYVGTKAEVKRMSFDLAQQGVEHRVARDADDPKRWHLAVRGGAAGSPRVWLTSIRGVEAEDRLLCHEPADGGQHPLVTPEVV